MSLFSRVSAIMFAACLLLQAGAADAQTNLPTDRSTMFSGSGNCMLCHGPGTSANVDSKGNDVSPPNSWRSTMMGNAAKDPMWQAMVQAETMAHPEYKAFIQDRCTNCHMPLGYEQAHADGAEYYSLEDGKQDPLAMDGVSCTLCHQIMADNLGTTESFSGGFEISPTRVTFGPYQAPRVQPMLNVTGFEPVFGTHIEASAHCGTCHTLFTPYLDNQGQVAGEFPEQTPYLEWLASEYPASGKTCQSCHVPALDEAIKISSLPMNLQARRPYFLHHFVGGNTFMLNVLKANGAELGVTADAEHFNRSIERTKTQLRNATAALSGTAEVKDDAVSAVITVQSLTGHKIPTGFPSRRFWLHVTIKDQSGTKVYEGGAWDQNGEIIGIDPDLEAHHQKITTNAQVQIYEAVMGDVDGKPTLDLLRASQYLKDNRLPPKGFSPAAMQNDSIGVFGAALLDADFNAVGGTVGSGSDAIEYEIPVDVSAAPFTLEVDLCYQTIKPVYIEYLKKYDHPDIRRMTDYYDAADNKFEIIQSLTLSTDVSGAGNVPLPASGMSLLQSYPHPVSLARRSSATVGYELRRPVSGLRLELVNLSGAVMAQYRLDGSQAGRSNFNLPLRGMTPGLYFCRLSDGNGFLTKPLLLLP